jgi:hypothetical protein
MRVWIRIKAERPADKKLRTCICRSGNKNMEDKENRRYESMEDRKLTT